MKTQIALIPFSLIPLLLTSAMAVAKPKSPSVALEKFQTGLGNLYAGYLNIQQALANDDFPKARIATDSLIVGLKAIPTKGLVGAAKSRWDSSAVRMTKVMQPMASAKDIAAMRKQFKDFTPLMVDAIERFGMKPASAVYLLHCPMYGPQGGDWLQKDKMTANPFYGSEMLECGSVVREVKNP